MDESTTATRHLVTLKCGTETRQGWLTSDEAEELWAYAKGLCLPVTVLTVALPWYFGAKVGQQKFWAKTGRDLPEGISVMTTDKE